MKAQGMSGCPIPWEWKAPVRSFERKDARVVARGGLNQKQAKRLRDETHAKQMDVARTLYMSRSIRSL